MKFAALAVLVLATAASAEVSEGVKQVRMFHDDGSGRAGPEAPERVFAPGEGRIHIAVDLAAPHRESAQVSWIVYQLAASGDGVPLMERSNAAANFESLNFSCQRAPEWKPGRYRIDLLFDGAVAQSTAFSVVKEPVAVKVVTIGLHQSDPAGQVGAPATWFHRAERRIWLRVVTGGCGGVPVHATLAPVDGDTVGAPVAVFDEPGLPDAARNVDVPFDTGEEWAPGVYRAEITAGGVPLGVVDLRIE